MPTSGQQSIVNARKNNGTDVVTTEWAIFNSFASNIWPTLASLMLVSYSGYPTTSMTYTLINSRHAIWNGLVTTFTTSISVRYSVFGTRTSGSIVVANCTSCNSSAVIVRPCSGTAGHNYGGFYWEIMQIF